MAERQIIVGVTGGIAAFKAAALVSQLAQAGLPVRVVMTAAAQKFVGPATFAALSGRPVVSEMFDPSFPLGPHIELAAAGSLLCVAPASADFLAHAALGLAPDLLSTLYLCFEGPVLLAPAMNSEMWDKPAVQRNLKQLEEDGVGIIPPESGWLSCRKQGTGRMASPETVAAAIHQRLSLSTNRPG